MSYLCECCERYVESVSRSRLMADPLVAVCFDCFDQWYDRGITDPAKIKANVRAKFNLTTPSTAPKGE